MNVAIVYRENGMPSNVQSRPGHLKRYKSEVIVYVENDEPYNQRTIGKVELQQPTIFFLLQEWQSSIAKSSCNTARAGSSFNQQRCQCHQI